MVGDPSIGQKQKRARRRKRKGRIHPSITPRSNPRHCASGDTPRGGPTAPSCALRAHARENAAAARTTATARARARHWSSSSPPAGAPTHCACVLGASSCVATGTARARSQLGPLAMPARRISSARVHVTDHANNICRRAVGPRVSWPGRTSATARRHVQSSHAHLLASFCAAAVSCWGERGGWRMRMRMRANVGPAAAGTGNCRCGARVRAHGVH